MKNKEVYPLTKEVVPSHATHPGKLIADEMVYAGMKQKDLASAMQIASTTLNEIIHGKRNITAALALKLEKVLDIDAAYWMRLQVRYEIDTLRIKRRHTIGRLSRKIKKEKTNAI